MKKLAFLLASLLLVACGDDDDVRCPPLEPSSVPDEVLEAVDQQFPNETILGWCDGSAGYIAAFNDEELAMFAPDGTLVKSGNDDLFEDEACECEFGPDD